MVDFVSWREAKDLVQREPVLFAEIMAQTPETQSLEIHVMTPTGAGLHEIERDDTGAMPGEKVHDLLARIAAARNVRYAAIGRAEDEWPPRWA